MIGISSRPRARHVVAATGLALEARIARGPGVRAVVGGGNAGMLARLLTDEVAGGAAAIISIGIAGGLSPDMKPGTLVIGRAVLARGAATPTDERWRAALAERLPNAVCADVYGSDAVVAACDAKARLHTETQACVVDTESHVVAAVAQRHALPFAVLRVVSDPAVRALPPAACVPLSADGGPDIPAVLASLVRRPAQLLALAQTGIDAAAALVALLRGRRRLGASLAYPDLRELLLDVA